MRTIKVMNRMDPENLTLEYPDVLSIRDVFNDNGVLCHQLCFADGTTATFPAGDWKFYELRFESLF